jgi:hypothetical protein
MKYEKPTVGNELLPRSDIDILPPGWMLEDGSESQRIAIHGIYKEAAILNREGPSLEVNDIIDRLGTIQGVNIIERRSFYEDFGYRCAEYVFGEVYHEEWAKQFITDNEPTFWSSTVRFLTEHGYKPIEQPRQGDITAYGGVYDDGRVWFGHFGIYAGDNKVVSKYGRGPIAIHDLSLIAKGGDRYEGHWGDYIWFFAKDVTNLRPL